MTRGVSKDSAKTAVQAKKALFKKPGLSAYDFGRACQNALRSIRGHVLEIHVADKARPFDDDWKVGEVPTPLLVCAVDEEQTQWQFGAFAERDLGLALVMMRDPIHRRHNDIMKALALARLIPWGMLGITAMNVWYAPWSKSANFAAMLETCEEMLVLANPECPVLRQFWGKICRERGWLDAAETGQEARVGFCAALSSERIFQTKGGKVSPSKWLGLPGTFRKHQASWHTKAYGLTLYCILKGFSAAASDILNTSCMQKFEEVQPHKPCRQLVAKPPSEDAPLPAASSTDVLPPPAVAAPALEKQKQAGRDQAMRLRQKAENTMHAVGGVFQDDANGRYRIQYPNQVPRSISWTSRGQTAVALEALALWWSWHTDATGEMPPAGLGIACA
jgi:hypothetical protein